MARMGWLGTLYVVAVLSGAAVQGHAETEATNPRDAVFATVNGEPVLQSSFENALRVAGRQRFYHGKAPEAELVAFRKEIAERLVTDRILHQEAVRQGLQPDRAWVDAEFEKIERRYSASPQWHESGASLHREIRRGLEERSLIEQMDQRYRVVAEPSEQEVRKYYADNADKFTSPEQFRVSTILLKVDPSEPKPVWDEQQIEAEKILAALRNGGDFDSYSEAFPPANEEQLGYIHRGMLGSAAQTEIDKLKPGEISGVVQLLEGFAIFRLEERIEPRLNAFDKVRDRAAALLTREMSEQLYNQRMAELRESAKVEFTNPDYHLGPSPATRQGSASEAPVAAEQK